jgi:hypothetical protein
VPGFSPADFLVFTNAGQNSEHHRQQPADPEAVNRLCKNLITFITIGSFIFLPSIEFFLIIATRIPFRPRQVFENLG